jgi:hypothetical protein
MLMVAVTMQRIKLLPLPYTNVPCTLTPYATFWSQLHILVYSTVHICMYHVSTVESLVPLHEQCRCIEKRRQ